MIAVDTNLLIYAHREDSEWHAKALTCMKALVEGNAPWALPWPCVHEFIAIVTHPRVFVPPTPLATALAAVQSLLLAPGCRPISEGPGYFEDFMRLASEGKVRGPLVHDARIAAICLHNGVKELWTLDRDFARFAGLAAVNPLAGN